MCRIAAAGMMLELALNGGGRPAFCFSSLKKSFGHGKIQAGWEVRICMQALDTFDVGDRGPAAVITHTIKAHKLINRFFHLSGAATGVYLHILSPGKILEWNAECQHARPIIRLPPEQTGWQTLFVRHRAQEDVIIKTAFLENLRQGSGVSKTIHIK